VASSPVKDGTPFFVEADPIDVDDSKIVLDLAGW
jgi:hypothetical protein